MNKKHGITAAVILALLTGVGWALFSGEDQEFVEVKQLRDELIQKRDTMNHEELRAEFESLRERSRGFSDQQKRDLRRGGQQFMMQRFDQVMAMSPREQRQEIDKMIDRMEGFRQSREARGDEGRKDRGKDRGKDLSAAERDQHRKERLDRSSPEMRGKMDVMKDLINDRRAERGLDPIKGPRGMFGGGHGGKR